MNMCEYFPQHFSSSFLQLRNSIIDNKELTVSVQPDPEESLKQTPDAAASFKHYMIKEMHGGQFGSWRDKDTALLKRNKEARDVNATA